MTSGLLEYTQPSIDQDEGYVRSGSPCCHVSGVLDVSRSIGNNELASRRREVAIGYVNGNACSRSARRPSVIRAKSMAFSPVLLVNVASFNWSS